MEEASDKPIQRIISRLRQSFDPESRRLFKNSSWVFASNAIGALLAFIRSIIIARGLGTEFLGQFMLCIAFVLTIQEILKLNVAAGVIRFGAIFQSESRPDKTGALIKSSLYASLISAALSVLLIAALLPFFKPAGVTDAGLLRFTILFACVNGIGFVDNIAKASLKLFYRFKINAIIQVIIDAVEFLVIATCLFLFPKNLEYFFICFIVARLLNTLICISAAGTELKKELGSLRFARPKLIRENAREIVNFITGNSLSNTLKTLMNQGDILLAGSLTGASGAGVYAVSRKLAYSVLTLTDPLTSSIYPQIAHLISQKALPALKVMLRQITRKGLPLLAIVALPAFLLRENIMGTLYGADYRSGGSLFFVHLLGALQGALFFWCLPLIQSLGLTQLRFRIYLLAIACGWIFAYLLAPSIGNMAIALGLLIANLMITFLFLYFARHELHRIEKAIPQ